MILGAIVAILIMGLSLIALSIAVVRRYKFTDLPVDSAASSSIFIFVERNFPTREQRQDFVRIVSQFGTGCIAISFAMIVYLLKEHGENSKKSESLYSSAKAEAVIVSQEMRELLQSVERSEHGRKCFDSTSVEFRRKHSLPGRYLFAAPEDAMHVCLTAVSNRQLPELRYEFRTATNLVSYLSERQKDVLDLVFRAQITSRQPAATILERVENQIIAHSDNILAYQLFCLLATTDRTAFEGMMARFPNLPSQYNIQSRTRMQQFLYRLDYGRCRADNITWYLYKG